MPPPSRCDIARKAICAGLQGQIQWKPAALERFRRDPKMAGCTDKGLRALLWDYVKNGNGDITARAESDADRRDECPWWYFCVLPFANCPRGLFVKFILLWEEEDAEDEAFVEIVSVHEELEGKVL